MTNHIYLSPRARATILWVIVIVALVFLWQIRDILSPFIWAIITAYVLNPLLASLARRTGLPRRLWAIVSYALVLGLLVWGVSTLVPALSSEVQQFSRDLPDHVREAGKLLGQREIDVLGVTLNLSGSDAEINRQIGLLVNQFGRNVVPNALPHVFASFIKLLLYLIATFFLLLEAGRIGPAITRFTPTAMREELGPWLARINSVLGAYIRGQLFLVVLMSVVSYIALTILGVRYAPLLAIFTGLVETMPFVGPYIAGGTAVLVALTQGYAPFGWSPTTLAIAVALTYTVLRQVEDNFVMPFVVGRLVHLHPLVVIFSVLSGATLAGILGLLLAVPVAATIKIVAIYLYRKFSEQPPRTVVLVEPADTWDAIATHIRESVLVSKAEGASRPRLLISVPMPPPALLEPAQFHRLPALLAESNADASIFTENADLIELAGSVGIPTQSTLDTNDVLADGLDFAEERSRARLGVRGKGKGKGTLEDVTP